MLPPVLPPGGEQKVFNIPYPGGTVIVATLIKYVFTGATEGSKTSFVAQYSADGTTVVFSYANAINCSVSVNDGVMTVTLRPQSEHNIIDCRCCLIPGDPFA